MALSAISVSASLAHTFHSESSPTKLTGVQVSKNKFAVAGQSVECSTATYQAFEPGKELLEVSIISPTYETCNYGANFAFVNMKGCYFSVSSITEWNAVGETYAVSWVKCAGGAAIGIEVPGIGCEIIVKETGAKNGTQTAASGVRYTNEGMGSQRDVNVSLAATVKVSHVFTKEPHTIACTNIVGNGKLTGTVTVKGDKELTAEQTGIWVE
jgi:hypothetical protein